MHNFLSVNLDHLWLDISHVQSIFNRWTHMCSCSPFTSLRAHTHACAMICAFTTLSHAGRDIKIVDGVKNIPLDIHICNSAMAMTIDVQSWFIGTAERCIEKLWFAVNAIQQYYGGHNIPFTVHNTNSAWVRDAFVCVVSVCMDAEHIIRIWAFDSFFFSLHFIQSFKLVSYLIFRSRYSCLNSLLHAHMHTYMFIYTLTTSRSMAFYSYFL